MKKSVKRILSVGLALALTVLAAYQTQLVAEFLLVNYEEAFFPAFAYSNEIKPA